MINGIKPTMTKTTELRIKPTSFDEAMEGFCTKLEENCKPYVDSFKHMDSVTFRADGGNKYIKVKSFQVNIDTNYETGVKKLVGGLRGSIHCFVEKPLGSSSKQLSKLENLLKKKNKLITMMGYQLRFNPLIEYLNKVIKKKSPIGKLISANIHHGENIKDFHPYEDYKISYAANKKLGGGVILTQIHEIDYFLHLFSDYKVTNTTYISSKVSELDIDVEDIFSSNFLLKKNKNKMLCSINLNYFERPKKRKFYLIGDNGSLVACFNTQKIHIFKNRKEKILKFSFKKNDIFIKEIKFFISKVKSKKPISKNLSLYNGIKTLRFALKLKDRFIK